MLPGDPVRMKVCTKPEKYIYGSILELEPGARYPINIVWDNGSSDWYDETEIQRVE